MAQKETYNEKINEFIDWVSGKNTLTNTDATGGLPVQGGRIRELLQNHLKTPIYLYENRQKAKYQIFSSEEAKDLYEAGGYDELLLGEFDGPAAYKMSAMLISNEQNYLTDNSIGTSKVEFNWACINAADNTFQKTSTNITVSIINNGTKIYEATDSTNSEPGDHASTSPEYQYYYGLDVLPHLQSGTNYVTVTLYSETYNATATLNATYNLIEFQLSEDLFNPFNQVKDDTINVQPEYSISIESTCVFNVFIDTESICNQTISSKEQVQLTLPNLDPGIHVMTLYMSTTIQGIEYRSNVICKQFIKELIDTSDTTAKFEGILSFSDNSTELIEEYKQGNFNFNLQQYSKFTLRWGLGNVSPTEVYDTVTFYISDSSTELSNEELVGTFSNVAVNIESEAQLQYIPKTAFNNKYLGYVINNSKNFKLIGKIQSIEFTYASLIQEASSYVFKYDAFGKNNINDSTWTPVGRASSDLSKVECTPININFTITNGWYENAFRTRNSNCYLLLSGLPFTTTTIANNFTFVIDFMTEFTANDQDLLVNIGDFIKIYPNKATLYDVNNDTIIETNFRSGERIHLSFIKYPTKDQSQFSNLFLIVNNGIMERAERSEATVHSPSNQIKIGDSNSGIRVYSMRYYDQNLDWKACYNNWIYDSDNKADIVTRNNIYFTTGSTYLNEIDESKCVSIMDVVCIEGDISKLVNIGKKEGMRIDSIRRICPYDTTKNFTIKNAWIRTHGQSNINYPVPSFKIWSNKTTDEGDITYVPELELEKITQIYTKNRMQVYDGAIPANKWVLQSNFADSSCAHNGTFLRKWHDLCYAATFKEGSNTEYKLRTPPQLFTSGQTITPLDQGQSSDTYLQHGYNDEGKQWKDYTSTSFPYVIRTAPYSFPCMLFYRANSSDQWIFFGQYVFMDDKKTDLEYGQRSIYQGFGDDTDPFVLCRRNTPYSEKNPDGQRPEGSDKYDKAKYRVWNNSNVCRIEVLDVDGNAVNFKAEPGHCAQSSYYLTWNDDRANRTANTDFELIYPDIDDLEDAEIEKYYGYFLSFHSWVRSTQNDPTKFQSEATQHLDLYKMAAYYLFCMMFGLVDSMNRNAQWKTYDNQHWHIEPWDMDVALGCKNNGGIAYNPPIDRTTLDASGEGAFSGKNSVLWNHLENWDYWINTIVPATAQALYNAGLKYDNIVETLDETYSNMWPEYAYNKSGEYKYIYSGFKNTYLEPKYLPWLQGARLTHRHWWLSTSLDYWFSKLGRGSFTEKHVKVDTNIPANLNVTVTITPSQKAFFAYYFQQGQSPTADVILPGYDSTGLIPITYTINESFSTKKPFYLCGLPSMEKLDISSLGSGFAGLQFTCDTELNSLDLGAGITGASLAYVNKTDANFTNFSYATNLQTLNIRGQYNLTTFSIPNTLKNFYCQASSFISGISATGNSFKVLHLPNNHQDLSDNTTKQLALLSLKDCSWEELKFFNTTNSAVPEKTIVDNTDPEDPKYRELYTGTIKEASESDWTIKKIVFTGKTCKGTNANNSRDFILKWIYSDYVQTLSTTEKITALSLENIEWVDLTYAQVLKLSEFYEKTDSTTGAVANLKGRITLASTESLDSDKLAILQDKFGDGVFTLGSSGIVIDYPNDYAVISIGAPAEYDTTNKKYLVEEKQITNTNGMDIPISYVKFHLQPPASNVQWQLKSYESSIDSWVISTTADGKPCVNNHSNVSIKSVYNDDTQKTIYYLHIDESNSNVVTEKYQFKLSIQGISESNDILFEVTPVTHSGSLSVDMSISSECKFVDDTLTLRSTSATATIKVTVEGTSQLSPKITWSKSGVGANYIDFTESTDSKSGILAGIAPFPDTETICYLTCKLQFSSCEKSYTIKVVLMNDVKVLTTSESQLLLLMQNALDLDPDLSENKVLYESDLRNIYNLTGKYKLSGLASYTTETGENIFNYLPNCELLELSSCSNVTADIITSITVMKSLTTLTLDKVVGLESLVVDLTQSSVTNLITTSTITGVKASENINLTLSSPTSLDLTNINGKLNITSLDKLKSITISNDSTLLYSNNTTRWLSLIPSSKQLTTLSLTNVKECSASSDQSELAHLVKNASAETIINAVGNIKVNGYYKYYANYVHSDIYNLLSFDDYYVLYNKETSVDITNNAFDSIKTWIDDKGKSIIYGNVALGLTNKTLSRFSVIATDFSDEYKLALTNLDYAEFTVYSSKTEYNSENLFNKYLTGYNQIDLTGSICDPKLNVTISGLKLTAGNPSSLTVIGNNQNCELNIVDTSNISKISVSNIKNTFSTLFTLLSDKISTLSGTITGTETIVSGSSAISTIMSGLSACASNYNLTLTGTINGENVIYLPKSVITTLQTRYTNLTLNVSETLEAVDEIVNSFINYAGIVSKSDMQSYEYVGEFLTDALKGYASSLGKEPYAVIDDFQSLCNQIIYFPEAAYLKKGYYDLDKKQSCGLYTDCSYTNSSGTSTTKSITFNNVLFIGCPGKFMLQNSWNTPFVACYPKIFDYTSADSTGAGCLYINDSAEAYKYVEGLSSSPFVKYLYINGTITAVSSDPWKAGYLAATNVGSGLTSAFVKEQSCSVDEFSVIDIYNKYKDGTLENWYNTKS